MAATHRSGPNGCRKSCRACYPKKAHKPGPLSFDGCGINGGDEYRSRIATFTERRGEDAQRYGPMFAASEGLLEACERAVRWMMKQPKQYQHVGVNGACLNAIAAAKGRKRS